jgi:hypothetical protein
MIGVGARGVVHMPQFNGKQEGKFTPDRPNLRCPRNGKQTSQARFSPRSAFIHQPLDALRLGR